MEKQKYIGARLFPWQKAVTDAICDEKGTGRVCVVKAHRQAGKSFMSENILLWYAINYKKTTSAMISPTLNQSRALFKELTNAIIESGIVKSKNEQLLTLELINGSTIFFKSAEQKDALRGFHISGILILDEAAYLTDDILPLVLPWRNVSNAPLLIVSTPFMKSGFYWRYWCMGNDDKYRNTIAVDWCDFDTSELLTQEQRESYKKILPKNQYLTEIEGQFIDGDGMVFTNIRQCVGMPQNGTMVYVGIDWGSGKDNDDTSVTMFNEHGEMIFIDCFNDLGTFEQVNRVVDDLKKYQYEIVKIEAECNSIGSPFIDLLKKTLQENGMGRLVSKIEEFNTTNAEKVRLVNQTQVALEQNKITLLDDEKLLNQLAAYAASYNPKTNNVSYNAPLGLHDDMVISTMLGYDAYKSSNTYTQNFIRAAKRKEVRYHQK